MFSPQNILVTTDFSLQSDKALRTAVDIAEKYHSRIYLLHVIDTEFPEVTGDYYLPDDAVRLLQEHAIADSLEQMKAEMARIMDGRKVDVIMEVKRGLAYSEIVREQEDRGIELTIMPGHNKAGVVDRLLGTTAERVARHASTPILMV